MAYAMQSIEDLYANGLSYIIDPTIAGAMFIMFFLGVVFLKNLPTTAKVAIGVPTLFIGFGMMGLVDFNVLLVLGLGLFFTFALWRVFGNR